MKLRSCSRVAVGQRGLAGQLNEIAEVRHTARRGDRRQAPPGRCPCRVEAHGRPLRRPRARCRTCRWRWAGRKGQSGFESGTLPGVDRPCQRATTPQVADALRAEGSARSCPRQSSVRAQQHRQLHVDAPVLANWWSSVSCQAVVVGVAFDLPIGRNCDGARGPLSWCRFCNTICGI